MAEFSSRKIHWFSILKITNILQIIITGVGSFSLGKPLQIHLCWVQNWQVLVKLIKRTCIKENTWCQIERQGALVWQYWKSEFEWAGFQQRVYISYQDLFPYKAHTFTVFSGEKKRERETQNPPYLYVANCTEPL